MAFPWGLVLFVASTVWSFASKPGRPKDRRKEGYGQPDDFNASDPTNPIGIGYGIPVFDPDVLFDFYQPDTLNSQSSAKDVRRFTGLSLGGTRTPGIDGRNLQVWRNDRPLFETVTEGRLTEKPGSGGKVWLFDRAGVDPDTLAIFVDGIVAHAGPNSGETVDASLVKTFTGQRVEVHEIGSSGPFADPEMKPFSTETRVGGVFPLEGEPYEYRIGLYFRTWVRPIGNIPGVVATLDFSGVTTKTIDPLPDSVVHLGRLSDGRRYFWVQSNKQTFNQLPWLVHVQQKGFISHFAFTGKIKPEVEIHLNGDGTAEARFKESQAGSTLLWTGKTKLHREQDILFHFRDGRPDQDPLPFQGDGARNTFPVGTELAQGVIASYTTRNEVHDLLVGVSSGPAGFYDISKTSGNFGYINRDLTIRIRENGAPDGFHPTDPTLGWVAVWSKKVADSVQNTALWFFSAADLLAEVQGKTKDGKAEQNLPFAKYDVEVVSGSPANVADSVSDLFLANVTEVRKVLFNLPHHATLTVESRNPRVDDPNPYYRVGIGMRKVWVPEAGAVYDETTGLPQPGAWTFTRSPIWAACDLITDPLFALGEFFTWEHINVAEAIAAAAFCDAQVRKHKDTTETETRAEVDIFLRNRASLLDQVRQILRGSLVMPTIVGGTWGFVIDQDADPVFSIVEGEHFDASSARAFYPSLEQLPTHVEYVFTDEDQDQRAQPGIVPPPEGTEPLQRVISTINLEGVRRATQAARVANLYRAQVDRQRWGVEFKATSWELLQLEAGDIVRLTSPTLGFSSALFRVQALAWDSDLQGALLRLHEHVPAVYAEETFSPNSAVTPGLRAPSGTIGAASSAAVEKPYPKVRKVALTKVAGA